MGGGLKLLIDLRSCKHLSNSIDLGRFSFIIEEMKLLILESVLMLLLLLEILSWEDRGEDEGDEVGEVLLLRGEDGGDDLILFGDEGGEIVRGEILKCFFGDDGGDVLFFSGDVRGVTSRLFFGELFNVRESWFDELGERFLSPGEVGGKSFLFGGWGTGGNVFFSGGMGKGCNLFLGDGGGDFFVGKLVEDDVFLLDGGR